MSIHSSMSPKAQFNRMMRDQTSNKAPLPMRSVLNNAYLLAKSEVALCTAKRDRQGVARAKATMAEASDQLQLLNLCDFIQEFDSENLKKAIEAFDAETWRMIAEAQ